MMASPLFFLLALVLYFSPLKKQQIIEHILKVSEAAMEKMKGEIGEEERSNCDNQGDGKLKVRILVVDDSLLDRKVVERLLNKSEEGFEGKLEEITVLILKFCFPLCTYIQYLFFV